MVWERELKDKDVFVLSPTFLAMKTVLGYILLFLYALVILPLLFVSDVVRRVK